MAEAQKTRERNREWMREYRATPEGKAANHLAKQRRYATPEGHAVLQAARRRYRKSEKAKARARELAKQKYVPRAPRPRLSSEERKQRAKESNLRSINRPGYREKRRATAWVKHLQRRYGLTPEQYALMAVSGCQICGQPDTQKKRLHVDHDHESGKVRGLLCDPCNRGLGCFRDDGAKLFRAILYLRRA